MSQLELVFSEKFGPGLANTVKSELGAYLDIDEPKFYVRKALELDSFIQLIGAVMLWDFLRPAAQEYLKTIAKRAGDATWDGLASLFKRKEVEPLAEVATILVQAADAVEGDVEFIVGLDIPDSHFGTTMAINARQPEKVARLLAEFIVRADQISKAVKAEIDAGHVPAAGARITLESDGSMTVRWTCKSDLSERHLRIP